MQIHLKEIFEHILQLVVRLQRIKLCQVKVINLSEEPENYSNVASDSTLNSLAKERPITSNSLTATADKHKASNDLGGNSPAQPKLEFPKTSGRSFRAE